MSKVRNISGGPLDVPLLDRVVADGETVDVPDFQPGHDPASEPGDPGYLAIVWPGDKWQPVGERGGASPKPMPAEPVQLAQEMAAE